MHSWSGEIRQVIDKSWKRIRKLTVLISICPLLAVGVLAGEPAAVLGLKLPYPLTSPTLTSADTTLNSSEDDLVRLQLHIDKKGVVSGVTCDNVMATARMASFTRFLKQIRFKPGSRDGKSTAQVIPVEVYLFADHRTPFLTFPISPDSHKVSARLFRQALEANGVTLPRLSSFPSYHSTISGLGSDPLPPYALIAVDLGANGSPTGIHLAHTDYPSFAGQVVNAANWATYLPAYKGTVAAASACFLLVTYYPAVQYPTKLLHFEWPDTTVALTYDRLAVRLLPDTLDYLSGPIPYLTENSVYAVTPTPGAWRNTGIFRYKIDKGGSAYLVSGGNGSVAAVTFGNSLAQAMRFYPARNKWGYPVSFEGVVKVMPEGKSNVRVKFLWLQ